MLNFRQSKHSLALLYTTFLTLCQAGTVQAMDMSNDPYNKRGIAQNYTIAGTEGKMHQVRVTPHKTTISNVNPEEFSAIMNDILLERGLQVERPKQTHQNLISLAPHQNPFYAKGQAVVDILESLVFKKTQGEARYDPATVKTRRFNTLLKQEMSQANIKFLDLLKQNNFSPEAVSHLSELTYGIHKLEENYFNSMASNLTEENKHILNQTKSLPLEKAIALTEEKFDEGHSNALISNFQEKQSNEKTLLNNLYGYASAYIDPENRAARQRFIQDALDIFEIRSETSKITTEQMEKSRFNSFHSFIKIYLGLVRDTTGGLFARDMALNLTSTKPADNGLGENDMNARKKVFSLHYLGSVERTFQILDELKPLADIAYEVGCKFFNRQLIEDQLSFARNALNELFFKEHGIGSAEEVREEIPTDLPRKPPSKDQKKKINKHKNEKNIAAKIQEQQAENQAQEKAPQINARPTKIKSLPLKQEEEISDETYKEWFYRTQIPASSKNLKSEYRTPTAEQLHQAKKAAIKNSKREKASANNEATDTPKDSKVDEKEETQIKENIKSVIHSPHKNGSKKLRPEHTKNVRKILLDAGHTLENVQSLNIGGSSWKVFQDIYNLSYSGEMSSVINMIRALKGHVDETRSGSRIGIFLRHIKTNEVMGTDLLSPGE